MRPLLALVAALCLVTTAASLDAAAQQSTPVPAVSAEPATATVVKAGKKHRTARHRRTRYASLRHRMYSPCEIIDGWRAFPTRDRDSYFDTRPVCRRY
jgi:hypothetical protein